MAASKRNTRIARKPRALKVRPIALEARPHKLGGVILAMECPRVEGRPRMVEITMGDASWWQELTAALGSAALRRLQIES